MPKKSLEVLTESMFYVLMAFWREEKCGAEVAAFVEEKDVYKRQVSRAFFAPLRPP